MSKGLKKLILVVTLCGVLTGCGNSDFSGETHTTENAEVMSTEDAAEETIEKVSAADGIEKVQAADNQKLIKTVDMTVETKEFEQVMESVNSKISELGGYLENSEIYDNSVTGGYRSAYLKIRVPAENLQQFISVIEENTNVTYKRESVEDVTLEYVDTASHIEALKIEQETLMGMLKNAENLTDIISIQSQLTEVRYEIESYESQKRTYDNQINYSTICADICEVARETTVKKLSYWGEVSQRFSDNIYGLGKALRAFSIWFIVTIPYFLIIVIIIAVIVKVRKSFLKKHKKENDVTKK